MPDEFTLLEACDDHLPIARDVDSIAFHRFVSLHIVSEGRSRPAVYPVDYAVPELVREFAFEGWPPPDLTEFRGGVPLIQEWNPPSEEATTRPVARVSVEDLNEFLANPRVPIGNRRRALALNPFNVRALLRSGRTLVRLDDGPPVLVEVQTEDGHPSRDGGIAVPDLADVVAGKGLTVGGERVRVSAENIRDLRERGATWLRFRGEDGPREVRLHIQPTPATSAAELATGPSAGAPSATVAQPILASGGLAATLPPWVTDLEPRPAHPGIEPPEIAFPDLIPKFEFVLCLSYRQEWTLVGFSRGDLLNIIALAPQEETTIEISSWDRRRVGTDTTEEFGWESSIEAQATGRITRDVTNELTRDEAWKLTSAGVNVSVPEVVAVDLDLAGQFGDTVNDVSRLTTSQISEATVKASAKARGMRQTKVTESREWGFEQKTTRRLRNQNLCRTVSYDVFEVLAAYDVGTRVMPQETRLAILVPNPFAVGFSRGMVIAFEGALRAALLDPRLERGFEAARWLAAREEYCALLKEPPCRRKEESAGAQPAPEQAVTTTSPVQRVLLSGDRIQAAVRKIRQAGHHVASAVDAGVGGAELEAVILEYRQWLFRVFGLEKFQPGFWGACLRFEAEWPASRNPQRVEQLLNETSSAWAEAAGRIYLAALLWPIALPVIGLELGLHLGLKTLWYAQYTARGFDDAGLGAVLAQARGEVDAWRKALMSPGASTAGQGALPVPPTPSVPQQTPAGALAAEPYAEAEAAANRIALGQLIAHLEWNRSHYEEAIWRSFGPTDRARILQEAFGNLRWDVEPEILGFFGDKLALPFRLSPYPQLRDALADAINDLEAVGTDDTHRVVLPTQGVQIDARIGDCDACEPFVAKHRELDLEKKRAEVDGARANAEQAGLERDRLQARLDGNLLDDPNPARPEIGVHLIRESDGGPEG